MDILNYYILQTQVTEGLLSTYVNILHVFTTEIRTSSFNGVLLSIVTQVNTSLPQTHAHHFTFLPNKPTLRIAPLPTPPVACAGRMEEQDC